MIQLCHTKCSLRDAGPLLDYLTTVNEWMNANPNEVVTILLTNPDGATASAFGAVMQASGLSTWAYSPGSKLTMTQWPTLQTMISNGDRLVMFLGESVLTSHFPLPSDLLTRTTKDYEADTASVPYILDEFAYFFETAYDETDSSFPSCVLDRPSNSNGSGLMMLVNHYLDLSLFGILIPNAFLLPQTNAATGKGSVGAQADLCLQTWGRVPNVILVDFFSAGEFSILRMESGKWSTNLW